MRELGLLIFFLFIGKFHTVNKKKKTTYHIYLSIYEFYSNNIKNKREILQNDCDHPDRLTLATLPPQKIFFQLLLTAPKSWYIYLQ